MEPIFVNKYIRTPEIVAEGLRRYHYISAAIPLYLLTAIIYAVCGINIARTALSPEGGDFGVFIAIPAMFTLFLISILLSYRKAPKIIVERDRELNQGSFKTVQIMVSEAAIFLGSDGCNQNILTFEQIAKAYQSKNTVSLITRTGQSVIFHKSAFAVGTAEDFILFLDSKGIRV